MALDPHTKYRVESDAYVIKDKMVDGDDFESEIGDLKTVDGFYPQYKLKRWANEANFSARIKDSTKIRPTIEGDKIVYTTPVYTARFYEAAGGFEFDITQHVKPASRVIEFTLRHKGLNFFYQPALTQTQIDEGVERPADIVGSYAVYHASKSNHISGQTNYKAGKAFHIKRPWAEDSTGKRVWCDLNINPVANLMTITLPKQFYNNSTWPILIDPTFGFSSIGGSNGGAINDRAYGHGNATQHYNASSGDTVTKIEMYTRSTGSGLVDLGVYDMLGAGVNNANKLGSSQINVPTNSASWIANSVSISLTAGNDHFLAHKGTGSARRYWDNTSAGDSTEDTGSVTSAVLDNTWTENTTDNETVSLFATYTTGGSGGIEILRRRIEGI